MGLFELRNLVEAVILTVPALYLCIAFLPFGLTAKIIVTLVVVVPVGGFGLIGINDDSIQLRASPRRASSGADKLLLGGIPQHRLHGGDI